MHRRPARRFKTVPATLVVSRVLGWLVQLVANHAGVQESAAGRPPEVDLAQPRQRGEVLVPFAVSHANVTAQMRIVHPRKPLWRVPPAKLPSESCLITTPAGTAAGVSFIFASSARTRTVDLRVRSRDRHPDIGDRPPPGRSVSGAVCRRATAEPSW